MRCSSAVSGLIEGPILCASLYQPNNVISKLKSSFHWQRINETKDSKISNKKSCIRDYRVTAELIAVGETEALNCKLFDP
jgi:hypothetical protein